MYHIDYIIFDCNNLFNLDLYQFFKFMIHLYELNTLYRIELYTC